MNKRKYNPLSASNVGKVKIELYDAQDRVVASILCSDAKDARQLLWNFRRLTAKR